MDWASKTYRQGFMRLADPKISLASFAGIFLGASFAARDSGIEILWLVLTLLGVFCVEVAKNASGELVDFDSGTDQAITAENRSPFSGGKRVLVEQLLTRDQTRTIAGVFFLTAIVIGLFIVFVRNPLVLAFGLPGIALAWYYHGGALRLSYRGLGELAVAMAYGPLVVGGTYFVQAGYLSAVLVHCAMSLGLLVAAFLWINEFPDYAADKGAGKNNLVVRLGRERAALVYVVLLAAAYLWLVFAGICYETAGGVWWGLLGLPAALFSARGLLQSNAVTARLIPAQVACLASFVLMAVGTGLGYWLTA